MDQDDARAARRLVMDNLPVFLWIGFLQQVALAAWADEGGGPASIPALLGGLVIGYLAVIRPRLMAEDARGDAVRVERWIRMAVHLVVFALAAYLGLRYLGSVLRDIGWPERRMGYAGLGLDSTVTFLGFVGFWSVFQALLAERLAPWVRELLKIERHVLLGFAVVLIVLQATGRMPAGRLMGGGWAQSVYAMCGFGIAYAVVMGAAAGEWRGRIVDGRGREWAGASCWIAAPAVVGIVIGVLGWTWHSSGREEIEGVFTYEVRGTDSAVQGLQEAVVVMVPARWWRALLDLTFCLGSIGICSYMGFLLAREIPLSFRWGRRMGLALVPVGVAWGMLMAGAYGNVVRLFVVLGCVVGPVTGGGRFGVARGLVGVMLAGAAWWSLSGDESRRGAAGVEAFGLVTAAVVVGFAASAAGGRGVGAGRRV